MLQAETTRHFDAIAKTWDEKEWVHSKRLNREIAGFLRATEKAAGLRRRRDKTLLYFGIGTGALFRYVRRYAVAGVDASAKMLGQCPEGVIQILSHVEELPFLMNNQFHLTFSRNLFKHCPEPEVAIEEMFRKTRASGVAIAAESIVLRTDDRDIPTRLVRMTDPTHPPFQTREEVLERFRRAGFSSVQYRIVWHRSAWLKHWVRAKQASEETHEAILELYRDAPHAFKVRHHVTIERDEITSDVPWLLVRAQK